MDRPANRTTEEHAHPSAPPPRADPSPDQRALLDFVATRDVECPACGYNVRGLKSPVCPECSGRLYLTVGSENLALGPWFLAVVSFALGAGFDLVVTVMMLVVFVVHLVQGGTASPSDRAMALTLFFSISTLGAAGLAGLWWLFTRKKRSWNRMRRRWQWLAAWTIFVAVGAVHAAFGLWWITRF